MRDAPIEALAASARKRDALPLPEAPRPDAGCSPSRSRSRQLMETQPVGATDGPERIESGWWDGPTCAAITSSPTTSDGATAWIYRDHRYGIDDGEWFLHGLFA